MKPKWARAAAPESEQLVPHGVRVAGAWGWRLLVIAAVTAVGLFLIAELRVIVVPLLIATLLAALFVPLVDRLHRHRWPRGLAVTLAMVVLVVVVSGLFTLAVLQFREGWPQLQARALSTWDSSRAWLTNGPLHLSNDDLTDFGESIVQIVRNDMQSILSGAVSVGSSLGHVVAGVLLTLFSVIFLLYDGRRIWRWIVGVFPRTARDRVDAAASSGWATLQNFVRVQVLVAAIDAVGIGLGAFFLGLPLSMPIAILVFLGSFIPVIGAVVTGAVAVAVALVTNGFMHAIIMLAIVLAVQQLEGHVLQPLIMGTAVKVHPLAVVLAVAGGSIVAGIPGALFAVPTVAFLNVFIHSIARSSPAALEHANPVPPKRRGVA